jgi:hypothetical protein
MLLHERQRLGVDPRKFHLRRGELLQHEDAGALEDGILVIGGDNRRGSLSQQSDGSPTQTGADFQALGASMDGGGIQQRRKLPAQAKRRATAVEDRKPLDSSKCRTAHGLPPDMPVAGE